MLSESFNVFKELMNIERTAVRDLQLLCEVRMFRSSPSFSFQDFKLMVVASAPACRVLGDLFESLQPIFDYHRRLLLDLEGKVNKWFVSVDDHLPPAGSDKNRATSSAISCYVPSTIRFPTIVI